MMAMTLPAWMTRAALMNQLRWATTENYDQFMGSAAGQGVQTAAITLTMIFAAFRAGKAFTSGSYIEVVPAVVYGATAFFAWSGKNAARRLVGIDGMVDRVVMNEHTQAANIAKLSKSQDEADKSLLETKQTILDLQTENGNLIQQLQTCRKDIQDLQASTVEFNDEAVKAKRVFDEVLAKKNHYKQENISLKQQNSALTRQVAVLTDRINDLSSKKKSV